MSLTTIMTCLNFKQRKTLTRMSKTWLTSFPLISMPLISRISSPSFRSPLRSAAPPRTMRLITTLSISLRTVAPCRTNTHKCDSSLFTSSATSLKLKTRKPETTAFSSRLIEEEKEAHFCGLKPKWIISPVHTWFFYFYLQLTQRMVKSLWKYLETSGQSQ